MPSIDTFIERLGGADQPAMRIAHRQEGYRDYTFGCRAGPGRASVRNLAHELAHAAEFGAAAFSRRCLKGSFCFKIRQVEVLGRYYPEPETCGATKRELRTFALQLHLLQHAGVLTRETGDSPDGQKVLFPAIRLPRAITVQGDEELPTEKGRYHRETHALG